MAQDSEQKKARSPLRALITVILLGVTYLFLARFYLRTLAGNSQLNDECNTAGIRFDSPRSLITSARQAVRNIQESLRQQDQNNNRMLQFAEPQKKSSRLDYPDYPRD